MSRPTRSDLRVAFLRDQMAAAQAELSRALAAHDREAGYTHTQNLCALHAELHEVNR